MTSSRPQEQQLHPRRPNHLPQPDNVLSDKQPADPLDVLCRHHHDRRAVCIQSGHGHPQGTYYYWQYNAIAAMKPDDHVVYTYWRVRPTRAPSASS